MMDWAEWQSSFYKKAGADNRISTTHISLYFALLHEAGHTFEICFFLQRDLVMQMAKISSRVTYNKCMRELHVYGYIEYMPSSGPGGSVVKMIELV